MVARLELHVDRPLGVEVLLDERLRLEGHEAEVAPLGQRLDLLDQLVGLLGGGKDAEQALQLGLEPLGLLAELRQAALGRLALADLLLQRLEVVACAR